MRGAHPLEAPQEASYLLAEGPRIDGCTGRQRLGPWRIGTAGTTGDVEQRDLGLDDGGEARLVVGELQEERLQLIPIQLGEQLRQGATRLDLVGLVARGQQGGGDVLAPATPIIRAGAGRTDRAVSGEGDLDPVGVDVGPPDVRLEQRTTLNQRGDGPAPVILAAPLERVGRGVGADGGIRVAGQAHGGPQHSST